MIGKWHMGITPGYTPIERGFDSWLGLAESPDYGCTDYPGFDTQCGGRGLPCARCGTNETMYPACPGAKWQWAVALLEGKAKIVEQPTDLRYLSQQYTDSAKTFISE